MKRGISLVALLITMVIMIALISSVTISGITTMNNSKKIAFATEINMIQGAVDTYKLRNEGNYPVEAKIELDISKVTEKSGVQFSGEDIKDSRVTLYKINYNVLGVTSLKYGAGNDENDMYAVSKDTGRVYYTKGLKIASYTYYTLTDDLKKIISSKSEEGQVSDGIIFNTSETKWTLDNVISKVNVPLEFSSVNVSVIGSSNTYLPELSGNMNVYTIDNIEGNYTIVVSYIKDGKNYSSEYTVSNVDKEPPIFTKDNVSENVVISDDRTDIYLSLDGYSDKLSGIKTIKYAYIDMKDADEVASYFKNNGLKVYNDIVEIDELSKNIIIYIEDKVGNFTALPYVISDETYAKMLEKDFVKDNDPQEIIKGVTYTAYIPDGFYYVGGNVSTGVVISDNIQDRNKGESFEVAGTLKGNQFVWVPVNYIIANQVLKTGISNFISLRTGWAYNSDISAIDILPNDYQEPYNDAATWENLEYAEMVQSIAKYGGFYVARYEAGKVDGTLVSKKDVEPWTDIPWGASNKEEGTAGAVYMSHQMYGESDSVVSHLIYGNEWDAIMYFAAMEGKNVSNSTSWGNYNDSTGDAANFSGTVQTTGKNDSWKTNNIYDIAGHVYEWTMESYGDNQRVIRSGWHGNGYGSVGPASYRQPFDVTTVNGVISFRVALYLK